MSGVPYTFATATTSIPLSQLDANFATNATLGNATVGLGNTTTVVGNLTLQNPTISGGTLATLGNTAITGGGTITSIGNVTLANPILTGISNNITFASGTNGIVFNNSGATANSTLNDYEVGTFTPVVGGSSTNPTITYSQQTGLYTKIGNIVIAVIQLGMSAKSGGSGNWIVTLPFNCSSESPFAYDAGMVGTLYQFTHSSGSYTQWGCRLYLPGNNYGALFEFGSAVADNLVQTSAQITGQTYMTLTYIYRASF